MPPVLTANPIAFHYNIISLVARFRDITLVSALDRQDFRENAGVCDSRRACGRTGHVMDRVDRFIAWEDLLANHPRFNALYGLGPTNRRRFLVFLTEVLRDTVAL